MIKMAAKAMRSDVWERLPDELMERVLTLLPLPSLMQMRAVSKGWSDLILSQDFINLCAHSQASPHHDGRQHFLLLTVLTSGGGAAIAAFSPASGNWELLSFDFLGSGGGEVSILACAGGLALIGGSGGSLVVCNPLTNAHRDLPPLPVSTKPPPSAAAAAAAPMLAALMIDSSSKSYKILVAGANGWGDEATFLFDTSGGSWIRQGNLPSGIFGFESDAIAHDGSIFAIASLPNRLLEFDLSRGDWRSAAAPLPDGAVNPQLVLCHGSLLLVAALADSSGGAAGICIWRFLRRRSNEWEIVESMPQEMCSGVFKAGGEGFDASKCAARGDWIYFSSYDASSACRFNLDRRRWEWIPNYKSILGSVVSSMFIVEPALDIAV